jgi:hypothetical protein
MSATIEIFNMLLNLAQVGLLAYLLGVLKPTK